MSAGRRSKVEQYFPALKTSEYGLTSPQDGRYNCVAWAAGDKSKWWDPSGEGGTYWPPGLPVGNFEVSEYYQRYIDAFASIGYDQCGSHEFEEGFEKVAIFEIAHVARQLPDGRWASKLGVMEDIEHDHLGSIEGRCYGRVVAVMRRRMPSRS
ncbi:DUF7689 domain-containing protein [Streptomyces mirabilis]